MLDAHALQLVKNTVPVLRAHGLTLTRHFYARLFVHHPELKAVFNQGHQQSGSQQQALAAAVLAYAEHIEDPSVLMPVLERVTHKHASLGIRAEHYGVVGTQLLASIREVLGEAATDELIAAWAAAYGQLADLMVGMERQLYQSAVSQAGGWTGWRGFQVVRMQPESEEIVSLYLRPCDGGVLPPYRPGQYVSVRRFVPQLGLHQPRQYSLSQAAPASPAREYRISVKRIDAVDGRPAGLVSQQLHRALKPGDVLELAPPMGDFHLHLERRTPVVLISAGVGITPLMAMLQHLSAHQPERAVRFVHACRSTGVQAFASEVAHCAEQLRDFQGAVFIEQADGRQAVGASSALQPHIGRLDVARLQAEGFDLLPPDADVYLCGPRPFMQAQQQALLGLGLAAERVHLEVFGTGGLEA